jgi:single-stranded-DNA-specific exonuclease
MEARGTQRWKLRTIDTGIRDSIAREAGVSGLVASVLAARGFSGPEAVEVFLNSSLADLPDPLLLPNMEAAVERLARAAAEGETVWVYADYDVDGVTSAAVLDRFLTQSGISSRVHLPRRDVEGYGLHPDAIRAIAAEGGTLLVTADCGVDAVAEAELARELGIDLIVTDHHIPGDDLPDAVAVVNPKLPGSRYPDDGLAGVGVAWNLAAGLRRALREAGHYGGAEEPDLRELLDLVALGTVADVARLLGVNRTLVASGLGVLNRQRLRPGIEALREVAGVKGEFKAGHIGFQIAPRLNAAGRMDDPRNALDLLCTEDPEQARSLAEKLDGLNRQRRQEELATFEEALKRVKENGWHRSRWSLVLDSDGWHRGVIGIVASRLAERYCRPAVVIAVKDGEARGSARSVPGLHLHDTLTGCEDLLIGFGGHAAAAGFEISPDRIDLFRERFEEQVRSRISEDDLIPLVTLDAEVPFADLSMETVEELERLAPFGVGNPTPVFLTTEVRVLEVTPLGRTGDHLKFLLAHGDSTLYAKAWRQAGKLAHVEAGQRVDLAHRPEINSWNGRQSLELVVEGMRPSLTSSSA